MQTELRIQNALNFIEDHLEEPLLLEKVAAEAWYSHCHFYQVFQNATGYRLKEYIRKRRLSRAAYDLISTDHRIIDLAMKYCFNCHEAFTRAFNKEFHFTPSQFRDTVNQMNVVPRLNLTGGQDWSMAGIVPDVIVRRRVNYFGQDEIVRAAGQPGESRFGQLLETNLRTKNSEFIRRLRERKIPCDWIIGTGRQRQADNTILYRYGVCLEGAPRQKDRIYVDQPGFYLRYTIHSDAVDHYHFVSAVSRLYDQIIDQKKALLNITPFEEIMSGRQNQNWFIFFPLRESLL